MVLKNISNVQNQSYKSDLLLLLTAAIWGFAFVAQRAGMEFVGPFTFNGIRFALGSFSILPLLLLKGNKKKSPDDTKNSWSNDLLISGLLLGFVLFVAATFQQIGMVYTSAGKAGFITGLYVILVPAIGVFIRKKTSLNIWIGAVIAVFGLYFLSVNENFAIGLGDLLVLISALFFAAHILIISNFSTRMSAIRLSVVQFAVCSLLSLLTAIFTEAIILEDILKAAIPIIYGGVFSVGVAYTLQIVGQKHAHASAASIILSLESVFAVLGGWLILSEQLSTRGMAGCLLMLLGMVLAQIRLSKKIRTTKV
jgi:drug/metabolite transporter (DMT)-like permease